MIHSKYLLITPSSQSVVYTIRTFFFGGGEDKGELILRNIPVCVIFKRIILSMYIANKLN